MGSGPETVQNKREWYPQGQLYEHAWEEVRKRQGENLRSFTDNIDEWLY